MLYKRKSLFEDKISNLQAVTKFNNSSPKQRPPAYHQVPPTFTRLRRQIHSSGMGTPSLRHEAHRRGCPPPIARCPGESCHHPERGCAPFPYDARLSRRAALFLTKQKGNLLCVPDSHFGTFVIRTTHRSRRSSIVGSLRSA